MARKQQKSSVATLLESVEKRRLALHVMLQDIESRVMSLQSKVSALKDEGQVQQMRRKLRYPNPSS